MKHIYLDLLQAFKFSSQQTGLRLALLDSQKTDFLASCPVLFADSSRTNITHATDNNIKTNTMGRLFIRSRSISSNTQVIRNYGPQSLGTAGTLLFWPQVPGITLY